MAVVRSQLGAKPAQIKNRIDPAQHMIGRNTVHEAKLVKQTVLPSQLLAHHDQTPPLLRLHQGITS